MIDLTITALSHAGEGIGRHAGQAVFVPLALPGEQVRAEITSHKKNLARARLLDVQQASPDRVTPPCPYFAACGGCHLQHLAYAGQVRFKENQVREQLRRVAGLTDPPVRPVLAAPAPWGYRNHMQFALTPEGTLGLQARASRQVIPVAQCAIAHPAINAILPHIQLEPEAGVTGVAVRVGDDDQVLVAFESEAPDFEFELDLPVAATWLKPDGATFALAGDDSLPLTVRGRTFWVSAGAFFQVNTLMLETLLDTVLAALALRGGETVLELYGGVGLFTAFVAEQAAQVVGVEASAPAVSDAAHNLESFENIALYEAPAEVVLPALAVRPQVVLLDPPRAGCAPEVIAALGKMQAARLVYVSCDPATLARDVRALSAFGYALVSVQPLDMFPQTHHVECVAVLELVVGS